MEDGEVKSNNSGKDGANSYLDVPLGTTAKNAETGGSAF